MVLHLVAITKLKLLAVVAGHGHGVGPLLGVLLCPFVLKLPFSRYAPRNLGDVIFSSRLFFFRLSRVLIFRAAAAGEGRWGRALRLLSGRSDGGPRLRSTLPLDEGSLQAVSMAVL